MRRRTGTEGANAQRLALNAEDLMELAARGGIFRAGRRESEEHPTSNIQCQTGVEAGGSGVGGAFFGLLGGPDVSGRTPDNLSGASRGCVGVPFALFGVPRVSIGAFLVSAGTSRVTVGAPDKFVDAFPDLFGPPFLFEKVFPVTVGTPCVSVGAVFILKKACDKVGTAFAKRRSASFVSAGAGNKSGKAFTD